MKRTDIRRILVATCLVSSLIVSSCIRPTPPPKEVIEHGVVGPLDLLDGGIQASTTPPYYDRAKNPAESPTVLRYTSNEEGITCFELLNLSGNIIYDPLTGLSTSYFPIEGLEEEFMEKYNDSGRGKVPVEESYVGHTGTDDNHYEACYSRIEAIHITCNKDFGTDYPAGTDLAPITQVSFHTVKDFILSRYALSAQNPAVKTLTFRANDQAALQDLHLYPPFIAMAFDRVPDIKAGQEAALTITLTINDYSSYSSNKGKYERFKERKEFTNTLRLKPLK